MLQALAATALSAPRAYACVPDHSAAATWLLVSALPGEPLSTVLGEIIAPQDRAWLLLSFDRLLRRVHRCALPPALAQARRALARTHALVGDPGARPRRDRGYRRAARILAAVSPAAELATVVAYRCGIRAQPSLSEIATKKEQLLLAKIINSYPSLDSFLKRYLAPRMTTL